MLRSAVLTFLLYGLPILAILLVLPAGKVTSLSGLLSAIKEVFTVYGGSTAANGDVTLTGVGHLLGDVAAIAFILMLLSSGATWIMGADRAMAAAGFDGAGPALSVGSHNGSERRSSSISGPESSRRSP